MNIVAPPPRADEPSRFGAPKLADEAIRIDPPFYRSVRRRPSSSETLETASNRFIWRPNDKTLWLHMNGNGSSGLTQIADLQASVSGARPG